MRHQNKQLVICLLLLLSGQSLAAEPDPAQALADMLGKFDAIHASFVQRTPAEFLYDKTAEVLSDKTAEFLYDKTAEGSDDTGPLQSGELWLQKPDKFRVETGPPLSQTVVSDGMSIWTHDRDLAQVIITRFEADVIRLPVLLLAGSASDIAEAFSVTRAKEQDDKDQDDQEQTRFLLIPRDDQGVLTSVVIVFQQSIPQMIILADAMQQRTIIHLARVNLTPDITGTEFQFTTDEPVDVIDDRD